MSLKMNHVIFIVIATFNIQKVKSDTCSIDNGLNTNCDGEVSIRWFYNKSLKNCSLSTFKDCGDLKDQTFSSVVDCVSGEIINKSFGKIKSIKQFEINLIKFKESKIEFWGRCYKSKLRSNLRRIYNSML